MAEDNFNKANWKPKFQSEFSMGSLDFERFDFWIREADKWGAHIDSRDVPELEELKNYFAAINALFRNWKALIAIKPIQQEYLDKLDEAKKIKRILENNHARGLPVNNPLSIKLGDLLGDIHTKLMETKQIIGLGIVMNKRMSISERIKKGIRRGKNVGDLPEA